MPHGIMDAEDYFIDIPEMSEWQCFLIGTHEGPGSVIWRPLKGYEPNWFWRKMQFLVFGMRWVKKKK